MGLTADLTYLHMNANTAIDKIDRGLHRWARTPEDAEKDRRLTDELAATSLRLRRELARFFERERTELVPRVRRIFGADVREVRQLVRYHELLLTALDRFIVTLTDEEAKRTTERQVYLARLRELFAEFAERYDERCDIDRAFYQAYSTVLYPGGLATE